MPYFFIWPLVDGWVEKPRFKLVLAVLFVFSCPYDIPMKANSKTFHISYDIFCNSNFDAKNLWMLCCIEKEISCSQPRQHWEWTMMLTMIMWHLCQRYPSLFLSDLMLKVTRILYLMSALNPYNIFLFLFLDATTIRRHFDTSLPLLGIWLILQLNNSVEIGHLIHFPSLLVGLPNLWFLYICIYVCICV